MKIKADTNLQIRSAERIQSTFKKMLNKEGVTFISPTAVRGKGNRQKFIESYGTQYYFTGEIAILADGTWITITLKKVEHVSPGPEFPRSGLKFPIVLGKGKSGEAARRKVLSVLDVAILPAVRSLKTANGTPLILASCIWEDVQASQRLAQEITLAYWTHLAESMKKKKHAYGVRGIRSEEIASFCVKIERRELPLARAYTHIAQGFLMPGGVDLEWDGKRSIVTVQPTDADTIAKAIAHEIAQKFQD